jgi:DNA-binding NarL/FixJ family response regulator
MHSEPIYATRALAIGAKGYLSKNASPAELRTALARIAAGLTYIEGEIAQALAAQSGEPRPMLSERDLEILRMLGEGRSFAQIADNLGLGYKTIANSATQIKSKLGVARTADLIRLSVEMGIGRAAP